MSRSIAVICRFRAHCRENPGARTCRAWNEARKSVRVLHREARRIAKDVTDLDGVPLYLSTCWMVQRLTSRSLASSRWLTPFDRSTRM